MVLHNGLRQVEPWLYIPVSGMYNHGEVPFKYRLMYIHNSGVVLVEEKYRMVVKNEHMVLAPSTYREISPWLYMSVSGVYNHGEILYYRLVYVRVLYREKL